MRSIDPIYIGKDAITALLNYLPSHGQTRYAIVADDNTYHALGERVENALKRAGYDATTVLLDGDHIHTDEHQITRTLIHAPRGDCTFIAVGGGTITDITRFVSFHTSRPFIGMPTAPSVDGFTSIGAPTVLAGVKKTVYCQAPIAIFADIDVLCAAPHDLVGAGYGDMIGKMTSVADWTLGSILWNEPFDAALAERSKVAVADVLRYTDAIGAQTSDGIRALMDGLIESGFIMLDFGASRPASGTEHHISHYWEMMHIREGKETQLHGAQVAVGMVIAARQYARLRGMSREQMLDRLEAAELPARSAEVKAIEEGYGGMAAEIIRDNLPFLDMTAADFDALKQRIAERWDDIQAIAAQVAEAETIQDWLRRAGAPAGAEELGLSAEEVAAGLRYGHYLRERFTVMKLSRILDIPVE
jgi:glycerol-1-phosphate dehydrogenase [NAD(P)+]